MTNEGATVSYIGNGVAVPVTNDFDHMGTKFYTRTPAAFYPANKYCIFSIKPEIE